MRRYIPLLCLFVFIYSSIGHFLLLENTLVFWKRQVKKTIKYNTPDEKLYKFAISEKLNWLEKGIEFEYQGNHYDVIKIENGQYFCWLDEKENKLVKQILAQFIQKSTDKNAVDFSIFKNIIKDYLIENQNFIHLFYPKINKTIFYYLPSLTPIFRYSILKPPCYFSA